MVVMIQWAALVIFALLSLVYSQPVAFAIFFSAASLIIALGHATNKLLAQLRLLENLRRVNRGPQP